MQNKRLKALISALAIGSFSAHGQLVVTPDTAICLGGTATLEVISAPSYGTSSYTFESIPYAPEVYAGTSATPALTDDSYSSATPIGFTFCFLGNEYTQAYIGSNGWLSFGGPGALTTTYTSATIPSAAAAVPKNCIMGPWQDWHPGLCAPVGSCVKYQTIGTAPNRKFVVSWDNVPMFSCTWLLGKFQIVLNETSNVIDNHLTNKPNCPGWAGGTATQGVHGPGGLIAFTAPGRNSTSWTTSNESTRFVPSGVIWYDPFGAIVGYGDSLVVSPTVTTTYTAFLSGCSGLDYTADITVFVEDINPGFSYDAFYCTDGTALPTITGTPGGTFTSVPAGLVLDPVTGEIDLEASIPATYSITYTVSGPYGACPPESATDLVTIVIDPDATFGYSDVIFCPTGTILPDFITTAGGTFSVSPAGLTVNPTTGQINLATGTVGTTYTITYTVGVLCTNTYSVTITIIDFEDPTFSYAAASFCPTGTASPTVTTPGGSFTVSPPGLDVDPVTGVVDLTSGVVGTTYTITYTTGGGACSNTGTTTLTIDPLDDATFSYPAASYCPTGTAAATVTTPGGTFTISPPTMTINAATGMVNLASGNVGTTYTITYTTPAGPCSNSSTETITIDPLDDPAFTYDASEYCNLGSALVTSVETPGGTFTISPVITINTTTGTVDLTTATPGTFYTITYTTPLGPCSNSSSLVIEVLPLTDAAFTYANSAYCPYGTAMPNMVLNPGGSFSAAAGISINSSTGEINLNACTPGGPYEVYYTSPGCPETDTFYITIYPLPTPTITIDPVVCLEGAPIIITGDPAGGVFSGTGVSGNEFDPALVGTPGVYTVTYTYTDANGCVNSTNGGIEIIENTVDLGIDLYIPEYSTTVLNPIGGTTTVSWDPPAGLSCSDCVNPVFDSLFSQTYTITAWDEYGCVATDDITINVVPVFDPVVFVPNTFTPNGDAINDFLNAFGSDVATVASMHVFDRWGELIYAMEEFPANDPNSGWDGTFNGEEVNQGVYAYVIIVKLEDGMQQRIAGNITLIR